MGLSELRVVQVRDQVVHRLSSIKGADLGGPLDNLAPDRLGI